MQKIVRIFSIFLLFLVFTQKSFAANNFSTDYNVTYAIQSSSDTRVNLNIILTNLTDNYYASSYTIDVGFTDIRNITASDSQGQITPIIKKINQGSGIEVPFNSRVIGLNKQLNFNISFYTKEVAQDLKSVWDVNIPGIANQNDFSNFSVNVVYPTFLGKPTFIKPAAPKALENATQNTIKFSKEDLGSSGISLAFGKFQVYDFNLTYNLENKNVFKTQTEIALPPSTNYQDVSIKSIFPKPDNVYIDKDGNWLAKYTLLASKKIIIKVLGQAKIFLEPKKEKLNTIDAKNYLRSQDFWETQNPKIISLAKSLNSPLDIYNYAVDNLKYDFSRVESNSPRLGAVQTLKNPTSAVCLEFTDLFIALARAKGIPARAVNGFAYTDNAKQRPLSFVKDVLHAWPQYYDFNKQAWIMVDPTWGNTTNGVDYFNTLDFDHFTFVINGQSSNYPVPAGGYKFLNNINTKDVNVDIAPSFSKNDYNLKTNIDIASSITAGIPINGTVKIENTGGTINQENNLYVYADNLKPNSQTIGISQIPPFGYVLIPFSFDKTSFLTKHADTIRIAIGKTSAYKNVVIVPFFLNLWIIGGILFVSIIFILSAVIIRYWSLSFLKQRREDNLRRESDKS